MRVRAPRPEDLPAFLRLVDALADYEHLPRPGADAHARLVAHLGIRFQLFLAELEGEVVGYAVFFSTYSTFLARPTLYLEDLFVRPGMRGRGAGSALFRACALEAVRQDCGRMEWQVLSWNTPAQAFYRARWATHMEDWQAYRLSGDALRRAAEEATG